jgi:hypothetical protein
VSIASEDHIEPLLDCHGSSIDVGGHIVLNECLQQRLARYGELLFKPRGSLRSSASIAAPLWWATSWLRVSSALTCRGGSERRRSDGSPVHVRYGGELTAGWNAVCVLIDEQLAIGPIDRVVEHSRSQASSTQASCHARSSDTGGSTRRSAPEARWPCASYCCSSSAACSIASRSRRPLPSSTFRHAGVCVDQVAELCIVGTGRDGI